MKNKWMLFSLFLAVFLCLRLFSKKNVGEESLKTQQELSNLNDTYQTIRKKYAWHRWYHSEYAAEIRRQQYNEPSKGINELYFNNKKDFIPIENLVSSVVCSKESNTVFDKDFIYWSARVLPLRNGKQTHFYSTSYIGKGDFAHSNKAFDAFVVPSDFDSKITRKINSHGLTERWIKKNKSEALKFDNENPYGNSAIFSYNSGDIDNDGKDDFIFNRSLILSSKNYQISDKAPRRGIFWKKNIIGLTENSFEFYEFKEDKLIQKWTTTLKNPPHPKTPYAMFVLPDDILAVHHTVGIDFYRLSGSKAEYFATVIGIEKGEVQFGALGDFTGDGKNDIWISQVNTPEKFPDKKDHVSLLDLSKLKVGSQNLKDLVAFQIKGSAKYSDYDGIGSSLSPVAGDIDNDGNVDLSFTGHRHMNEAGALYILFGKDISMGKMINITAPQVVKILGRPMSQIAPPFHHWDATDFNNDGYDDLVIPVDNDVCSGLHSGSIYLLDGRKVTRSSH